MLSSVPGALAHHEYRVEITSTSEPAAIPESATVVTDQIGRADFLIRHEHMVPGDYRLTILDPDHTTAAPVYEYRYRIIE